MLSALLPKKYEKYVNITVSQIHNIFKRILTSMKIRYCEFFGVKFKSEKSHLGKKLFRNSGSAFKIYA